MQSAWQGGAPPTGRGAYCAFVGSQGIIVRVADYDNRNAGLLSQSAGLMVVAIHLRQVGLSYSPTPSPAINPAGPRFAEEERHESRKVLSFAGENPGLWVGEAPPTPA